MSINGVKNYHLYLNLNDKKIELMHDTLRNIDKFTMSFQNSESLINELFLNMNDNCNISLYSSRNNPVDLVFSDFDNVTEEFENPDMFEEFLYTGFPNSLFEYLNKLMNNRFFKSKSSKFISPETMKKLNSESLYLWDDNFKNKIASSNISMKEESEYLKYKSQYNEVNKDVLLNRILNDLLLDLRIRQKVEIESFLRPDYVEQESDLKKYISNYRNFRDLYLITYDKYNVFNKEEIDSSENLSTSAEFVKEKLIEIKNKLNKVQVSNPTQVDDDSSIPIQNFKKLEDEYKQNLLASLNNAINNGDLERESEIRDELSKYIDYDSPYEYKNRM